MLFSAVLVIDSWEIENSGVVEEQDGGMYYGRTAVYRVRRRVGGILLWYKEQTENCWFS